MPGCQRHIPCQWSSPSNSRLLSIFAKISYVGKNLKTRQRNSGVSVLCSFAVSSSSLWDF